MNYCEHCQVTISGNHSRCPLCQAPTTTLDERDDEVFPYVPTIYQKYHLFFRGLIFASVAIAVAAIVANLLFPSERYGSWSIFVLAGIGCLWAVLLIAIRKRNNIMKNLLYQALLLALLTVLWDRLTGWHYWSIDFAVPIIMLVTLCIMIILSKVLSYTLASQLVYLLISIGFGAVIPLGLVLFGQPQVLWPSVITIAFSLLMLAAILIFLDKPFKRELKRRLHF